MTPTAFLAVAIGGAIGSLLRWLCGMAMNPLFPHLPLGTLFVNLTGGFVIGAAIAYFDHFQNVPPEWRLFVITGLCGGFTTFSAFSGDTVNQLLRQQYGWSVAIISTHVIGSILMTLVGIGAVRMLFKA